jgi:MFS family permease
MRTSTTTPTMAALILLATATVVAAAVGGPWGALVDRFKLFAPPENGTSVTEPSTTPSPLASQPPQQGDSLLGLGVVLWVLGVAAALVVVWLVWRWIAGRLRSPADSSPDQALLGVPVQELPDLEALRQAVTSAQELLREATDPNDAIIQAWQALEGAAATSGVSRNPAATPTEFTGAVLAATTVDAGAVQELLHLYHRARFSSRGVTPDQLSEAQSCLQRLSDSWAAFDVRVAPPATPSPA